MMVISVGRQFGVNIPAGDDFASWCMARDGVPRPRAHLPQGEMIRVGLLLEQFTGKKRWLMEILALAVATAFTLYFTWYAVAMT